jgi:hypothetical protein
MRISVRTVEGHLPVMRRQVGRVTLASRMLLAPGRCAVPGLPA